MAVKQRFVIAPVELTDGDRLVVLSDIGFWVDNFDNINAWCEQRNAEVQGATIVFGDEPTLLEFVLRWS